MQGRLYDLLGIKDGRRGQLREISNQLDIPIEALKYYAKNHIFPSFEHALKICASLNITILELKLALGFIDQALIDALSRNYKVVASSFVDCYAQQDVREVNHKLVFKSQYGTLFKGDCLSLMASMPDNSVDVVFADPPFNLDKLYPSAIDDDLRHHDYIEWCQNWISECVRVLKPGGSFFLWNLPKWNTYFSSYLNQLLTFRHWISVDIKYSLPISSRLYPSHYSLLYYCKGDRPNTFTPDRLPMAICKSCYKDLVDYGGYKDKMNPRGISLTDVWYDIPPVRHAKYKKREGANELSVKLLDRIIELSSEEGDTIFDPFGGAGTTYAVAEMKKRNWIGVEIGPCEGIIERLSDLSEEASYLKKVRNQLNMLMDSECQSQRVKRGIWTPDTLKKKPE